MKKLVLVPLLSFWLTGCLTAPKGTEAGSVSASLSAAGSVQSVSAKKPVSADQVTEQNAGEMAIALQVELDEAQGGTLGAPLESAPAKPNRPVAVIGSSIFH